MIGSLLVLLFFSFGVIVGFFKHIPHSIANSRLSEYALYILMFLVGIGMGGDKNTWHTLKKANGKIFLVPLTVIIGSLLGAGLFSLILADISIKEAMAVGSGFGYYSLSSIIITKFHGETLGVIALMANMIRELSTLIIAPILSVLFGKLAPIAAGGATSMDTTLPIITKTVGKNYAIISVFSGVILTMLVPFIVTFLIK